MNFIKLKDCAVLAKHLKKQILTGFANYQPYFRSLTGRIKTHKAPTSHRTTMIR
jgi:hypothetical protein